MANIYMYYFKEFSIESSLVKEAMWSRCIDAVRCTNTVKPFKLNKTFHIVHARIRTRERAHTHSHSDYSKYLYIASQNSPGNTFNSRHQYIVKKRIIWCLHKTTPISNDLGI